MSRVRVTRQDDREVLEFQINGASPDFQLTTEPIATWGLQAVKPRFLDLLDIAGAVFAADGMFTRGALSRPKLGAGWGRRIAFEIEVRDTSFWRNPKVKGTLEDMIRFLTEDDVAFTFGTAASAPPPQRYFQFQGDNQTDNLKADHVVLFSGGLDSLAGALETLSQEQGRVVLVTHRSAQKNTTHQNHLAKALQRKHPSRVSYVPILATRKGSRAVETTQRSRSFLFAAFGFVIARISGVSRLTFFENGIVSQNLPLSPQIIGTMATRTTHPLTLTKFAALLSLVGERSFEVRNPFQWITKKEVVEKIQSTSASDLIRHTVSCNHVWKRTKDRTHCGACSQCLDRRFGIMAAGLQEYDPETSYTTSILFGDREDDRSKVEAVEWTRHALRLDGMDIGTFQARFGGDVARIALGHAGLKKTEVLKRTFDLQQRHGAAVRSVIEATIASKSRAIASQTLSATSLFRLVLGDLIGSMGIPEVDVGEVVRFYDTETEQDQEETVLILQQAGDQHRLTIHGLGSVTGAPAGPVFALYPQYARDKSEGLEKLDHRYLIPSAMIPVAGSTVASVIQNVRRCRSELAVFYQEIHGEPPVEPLLIQNKKPHGYRLDPYIVVMEADN